MKKGVLYALITAVLFVTLEPVSKLIAGEINPYAITFWRFFIGSFILIPPAVSKLRRENIKITARDVGITTALGVLFICISMVALQLAVKIADAPSLIAIIFSSNSVFTIVFAVFIIGEKLTKNKALALLFGILGVVFCADFSSGTNLSSVALALFAALAFSLYTALSQRFNKKLGGVIQTAMVFLLGSVVLFIALLFMGVDVFPAIGGNSLAILLYLGFLVTGAGYASYFLAIEKGGAIMASLAFFIKPILTPFVTFFINGIVPDIKVFLAVLCIVAASYFAVYRKKARD
ncbi:MAG: DMT family transporter [Ruminococcaceae bacterium]|nr:DMT family transporter [Oscillospiraceae bacterium]